MDPKEFQAEFLSQLTAWGFFDKDGKPNFVPAADFGKSAAIINDLKRLAGSALTADHLIEAGLPIERGPDGKLRRKLDDSALENDPALAPLRQRVADLQAKIDQRELEIADEQRKTADLAKARAVEEALTAAGAVNAKRDGLHYRDRVEIGDDGSFWVEDGGHRVPLSDHVKGFLEQNPELRSRPKGASEGGRPIPANTTFPRSKMSDTSWYMQNREKIMSGEIRFVEDGEPKKRPQIDTRRYVDDPSYRQHVLSGQKA